MQIALENSVQDKVVSDDKLKHIDSILTERRMLIGELTS